MCKRPHHATRNWQANSREHDQVVHLVGQALQSPNKPTTPSTGKVLPSLAARPAAQVPTSGPIESQPPQVSPQDQTSPQPAAPTRSYLEMTKDEIVRSHPEGKDAFEKLFSK
jgi:hypothetical protein